MLNYSFFLTPLLIQLVPLILLFPDNDIDNSINNRYHTHAMWLVMIYLSLSFIYLVKIGFTDLETNDKTLLNNIFIPNICGWFLSFLMSICSLKYLHRMW